MKSAIQLIILAAAVSLVVNSQTINTQYALTIDKIINVSPKVEEIQAISDTEVYRLRSENRLAQPEIEFEHLWPKQNAENKWNIGIAQSFDFPSLYSSRSKQSDLMTEMLCARNRAAENRMRYQIEQELIELAAINKLSVIYTNRCTRLEKILEMVDRAATAGELTIMELNRVKLDYARTSILFDEIEPQRAAVIENLASITGLEGNIIRKMLPAEEEFPYPETTVEMPASAELECHPEMIYMRLSEDVARQSAKIARMNRLPGFSVGYRHAYEEGMHFNGFSVGLSLPIYSNRSKRLEAEAETLSASLAAESMFNELSEAANAKCIAANRLYQQILVLREPLENASSREILVKAYRGGEMSLLDMLRELEPFNEAELELLDLRTRYQKEVSAISNCIFD